MRPCPGFNYCTQDGSPTPFVLAVMSAAAQVVTAHASRALKAIQAVDAQHGDAMVPAATLIRQMPASGMPSD